jgi:hypothetical protein
MDDQDNNDNDKTTAKGTVDFGVKKDLEPEMIRDIFAEALKDNKVDGKLPGMMLEMLDSAINSSKKKDEVSSRTADNVIELQPKPSAQEPQSTGPREASPFEQEVQANIRKAVSSYIADSVTSEQVQKDKELNIDAAFLKDHGAALAGSVLGAFAKSIIPEDFKLDVTPGKDGEEKEGDDKEQVSVKLDIGGMLQTLFDSTQKGDQAPPADEE